MDFKSNVSALLTSNLKVDDKLAFNNYLKELWPDLISRRVKNQNDKNMNLKNQNIIGINKLIFNNYYSLPGIIGERLFRVFDSNRKDLLEFGFFKYGMNTLFCDNYQNILRFIFDFYDFDGDGKISKEDIRTVLSYVQFSNKKNVNSDNYNSNKTSSGSDMNKSIKSINTKQLYENSVKSQNQLFEILEKCFEKMGELINFDNFVSIVENINSEIFFMIYIFLLQNRPFSEKTIELYKKITEENSTILSTNFNVYQYTNSESSYNVSTKDTKNIFNASLANSVISKTINNEDFYRGKHLNRNSVTIDRNKNEIFGEKMNIWKTFYEIENSIEKQIAEMKANYIQGNVNQPLGVNIIRKISGGIK